MVKGLFYVSRKVALWPDDAADVEAITAVALSRNADLEITGALISTRAHFAQVLEGPAAAVDEVVASIARDHRHTEMTILDVEQRPDRWYPNWALAYVGAASYVSARIEPMLTAAPDAQRVANLLRMMRAFKPEA